MLRPFELTIGLLAFCLGCGTLLAQEDIAKWESDICQLEALDRQETYPEDAILFIGSSSIRLWENISEDMAPYPTIRRGYGGAKFSDLNAYIDRLIAAHDCRSIVIFVANDITGGENDKSSGQVIESVSSITSKIRKRFPDTPIFFIEITPTQRRWQAWRKIRELNNRIAEFCSDNQGVHFISTAAHYLDPATDEPIAAYFTEDRLHQNADGYQVWGAIIKSRLDQVLPQYSK